MKSQDNSNTSFTSFLKLKECGILSNKTEKDTLKESSFRMEKSDARLPLKDDISNRRTNLINSTYNPVIIQQKSDLSSQNDKEEKSSQLSASEDYEKSEASVQVKYTAGDDREEFRQVQKRDKIDDSNSEDSENDGNVKTTYVILPDNAYKRVWDIIMAIILIYSSLVTPYRISFVDDDGSSFFDYFDIIIDLLFFIDLVLNFFTAYNDHEDNVIKNQRKICIHYIKTWLVIDLLAVIPVNLILNNDTSTATNSRVSNAVGRVAKIPKLYRLIRLTKLFRMVKIVKKGNVTRLTRYFLEKLKVNANIERLVYFILAFIILNHLSACIFVLIAKLEDFSPDSWVTRLGFIDLPAFDLYIISFYWNLTTVTTVGYGDINAGTIYERTYNLFIMSFGVLIYSFAIGSLTSIVSTLDAKTSEMNQKLQALNSIKQEYKIDSEIYDKVRKIIKYDLSRNQKDKINFLQELPNKLRLELSRIIHDNVIKKMIFFKDKPDLIAFVAPLLKPIKFSLNEILYKISDSMDEMYFISKGTVSFFLGELCENKEVMEVKKNYNFGEIEMCLNEKLSHNIKIKSRNAELFILKKNDFLKLSVNFKDIIQKFLYNSLLRYLKFNEEKKKIMNDYQNKSGKKAEDNKTAELEQIKEESEGEIKEENESQSQSENDSDNDSQKESDKDSPNASGNGKKKTQISPAKHPATENFYRKPKFQSEKKIITLKNDMGIGWSHEKEATISPDFSTSEMTLPSFINAKNPTDLSKAMSPILEMSEHVEQVKSELYKKFSYKIERIMQFLKMNKITFPGVPDEKNPLYLLNQIKNTKEISERNEMIEQFESVIHNFY